MMHCINFFIVTPLLFLLLFPSAQGQGTPPPTPRFVGTTIPFAKEAIYFVLTDRFVDGDPTNNYVTQGGKYPTWQGTLAGPAGERDYVGYMGGDFRGLYSQASYIKEMGFTAIWITPIVDNPDQAFSGGTPATYGAGPGADGGKSGYHGYWGVNFFRADEHWVSPDFDFQALTRRLSQEFGLHVVLDIVGNHGSPAWSMPVDQPKYGEIYDQQGTLIADHQNLPPDKLDPQNPLHRFFNRKADLAQLADFDATNPAVMDYLSQAHLYWIAQGVPAIRIDTLGHQPHTFWKELTARIRKRHPNIFILGERYDDNAEVIAQHQRPENGGISPLDFPLKTAMRQVFEKASSDFANLVPALHLDDCVYTNPYELSTFYDNHDMARMNANEAGFIDAHNFIFTARGIPVIYYGSESRFMVGRAEHQGNRNFFGPDEIAKARQGKIFRNLSRIANLRRTSIALQRGLQLNVLHQGHRAAYLRVYQRDGISQTVLVLLNKGPTPARFVIDRYLSWGSWRDAFSGSEIVVSEKRPSIVERVPAHDVKVFIFDQPVTDAALQAQLQTTMDKLHACANKN